MGARRIRREQRQVDQKESRHRNGIRKTKERARREERMREMLKTAQPPYAPVVQSWLSAQLGKPARLITSADVKRLMSEPEA